jgi:hypothetical protein
MEDVSSFGREMIFHHRTGPFRRSAEGRLHEVTLRADENGYVLFRIFNGDIKTKQSVIGIVVLCVAALLVMRNGQKKSQAKQINVVPQDPPSKL